jgi:hypothetical protein
MHPSANFEQNAIQGSQDAATILLAILLGLAARLCVCLSSGLYRCYIRKPGVQGV